MKKNILLAFALIMSLSLVVGFSKFNNNLNLNNKNVASSQYMNSQIVNNDRKIYQTAVVQADFAKSYDNVDDLVADSELIVSGTVENLKSKIVENNRIYSDFTFSVDEVIKGSIDTDDIGVEIQGGAVPYSDYFDAMKNILKIKLPSDEFQKAEEDATTKGNELVEEIYCGVKNINDGDHILLYKR